MTPLAALKQRLLEAHDTTRRLQAKYLALPLEAPGKADAYLAMCEACREELDVGDAILAEKERLLAGA